MTTGDDGTATPADGSWPRGPVEFPEPLPAAAAGSPSLPVPSDGANTPSGAHAGTTSGTAVAALVLSIASWVVCPIVPAIVALVLAQTASREVRPGQKDAAGMILAARIISWINIGVGAAVVLVGGVAVLVIALAAAASS